MGSRRRKFPDQELPGQNKLGPSHPHANNLDTLASMVKLGHLCATSAIQKPSATFYNCSQSTQSLPLGSFLQNLSPLCLTEASRIFPILQKNTRIQPKQHVLKCHFTQCANLQVFSTQSSHKLRPEESQYPGQHFFLLPQVLTFISTCDSATLQCFYQQFRDFKMENSST